MKEVVSKWEEEQLTIGLVYQHLRKVAPVLAQEFAQSYHQMTPTLASESRDRHHVSLDMELHNLMLLLLDRSGKSFRTKGEDFQDYVNTASFQDEVMHNASEPNESSRSANFGTNIKPFSREDVTRIKKAMAEKEDVKAVAMEIGRSYNSVWQKIWRLKNLVGYKAGRFTAKEAQRMKQAVVENEDYKIVAKELNKQPNSVRSKMLVMRNTSGSDSNLQKRKFTLEEDQVILDATIPCLKSIGLSSTKFLPQSALVKLGKELNRSPDTVRDHWRTSIQPKLLQHYAGTLGFRVETMLANLVAEKYEDPREIDWSEILNQHKEFTGYTISSLRKTFSYIVRNARKSKNSDVSLQEVSEYAGRVFLKRHFEKK